MRPLRDCLGEAMRLAMHAPGPAIAPWEADEHYLIDAKVMDAEAMREHWRREADRLIEAAPQCEVLIAKQPMRKADGEASP